jgi:hypothetical protein
MHLADGCTQSPEREPSAGSSQQERSKKDQSNTAPRSHRLFTIYAVMSNVRNWPERETAGEWDRPETQAARESLRKSSETSSNHLRNTNNAGDDCLCSGTTK